MKIGYVGDSTIQDFHSARRFRLVSYTPEKFRETVRLNLEGLEQNITYAGENNLLFYRIRSEVIPFASHPVCTVDWRNEFADDFKRIGAHIAKYNMRISFHPDQFVVLNSPNPKVVDNSIRELQYQADVLNLLQLNASHKLQIHGGGVYGNKEESIARFATTHSSLPQSIRERLVVENDDRLFSVQDCYSIHTKTGIPILFDNFHFILNNNGEDIREAIEKAFSTWKPTDGIPMVDYSSQQEGWRIGRHSDSIEIDQFRSFIKEANGLDFDIMLEIKDKDKSALKALEVLQHHDK